MSLASMEKHLFNLKFAAKDLERCSKKCDKEEKAEKLKLKKAIEKGNHEVNSSSKIISFVILYLPRLQGSTLRMQSARKISP